MLMNNRKIIKIAAGLCLCAAGVLFILAKTGIDKEEPLLIENASAAQPPLESSAEETGDIIVHVCGAVIAPGTYKLPAGSRLGEAIDAAGGFGKDADRDYLNLATVLSDSQQIRVPTYIEAQSALAQSRSLWDGLVDINTADPETLMTLSGIGKARAEAIISYREEHGRFSSIEDIMLVPGIKEAAFSKIKDKIKVDG